jgi:hypothetical protein
LIGRFPHSAIDLGGQHDFLPAAALGHPAADDAFGHAFKPGLAVNVGGIENREPQFQGLVHHGEAFGLAGIASEIHGTEGQSADFEAGTAELYGFHMPLRVGGAPKIPIYRPGRCAPRANSRPPGRLAAPAAAIDNRVDTGYRGGYR